MKNISFNRATHGFFDNLVSYFVSISSIGTSLSLRSNGEIIRWSSTDFLTLEGMKSVSNCEIQFYPDKTLDIVSRNEWPDVLELIKVPLTSNPPNHPILLTGLHKLHGSLIQSAYVDYFESFRDEIEIKFGKNTNDWPPVWNFGRVIRNAFAHDSKISIKNPESPEVVWMTLRYNFSDNGKSILYQDISPVEVIFLMEEMDACRK